MITNYGKLPNFGENNMARTASGALSSSAVLVSSGASGSSASYGASASSGASSSSGASCVSGASGAKPKELTELLNKYRSEGCTKEEIVNVLSKLGISYTDGDSKIRFNLGSNNYCLKYKSTEKSDDKTGINMQKQELTRPTEDSAIVADYRAKLEDWESERAALQAELDAIKKILNDVIDKNFQFDDSSVGQADDKTGINMQRIQLSQQDIDAIRAKIYDQSGINMQKQELTRPTEDSAIVADYRAKLEDWESERAALQAELDAIKKILNDVIDKNFQFDDSSVGQADDKRAQELAALKAMIQEDIDKTYKIFNG